MSCQHAETTTIAWIFGEAPDAHAEHVAACAECTAVLDLHERVGHATVGVRAVAPANDARAFVRPLLAGLIALAAVGLLAFKVLMPEPAVAPAPIASLGALEDDAIDRAFDELDADLDVADDEFSL